MPDLFDFLRPLPARPFPRVLAGALLSLGLILTGCGGGGGGSSPTVTTPGGTGTDPTNPTSPTNPGTPVTPPVTPPGTQLYSVGGVLAGLGNGKTLAVAVADGTGKMLQTTTLSVNGAYTVSQVPAGSSYSLSISTQPVGQSCTVSNGSGTVSGDTNTARIDCTDNRYTVGGSTSGNQSEVSLFNNATGETLTLSDNSPFTFKQTVAHGSTYGISVQSSGSGQSCSVTNASGTATAAVSNVGVTCMASLPAPPAVPANLAVGYSAKNYAFTWTATTSATYYELMEDPDGAGPLAESQVGGSIASASYTHSLAPQQLYKRLNVSYRLRACNPGGCSAYTAALVPDLTKAIGYFKASNTGANDDFGNSVALSGDGNTLAVGADYEDSSTTGVNSSPNELGSDSGAVYVFTRSAGVWSQQAYVKASNTGAYDYFGRSVALSGDGNTLAVGALQEASSTTGVNSTDNELATNSGAVYVFTRSAGAWSQQAYVKASNTEAYDYFGSSVALSGDGNTLAVGAIMEDSSSTGVNSTANELAGSSGAVYVFTRSAGAWSQQAYVKASNTEAFDYFGRSVALSGDGNTLAVGATREDSNATGVNGTQANNSATDSGAVYVFTRSAGAWSQQAYVKASNTGATDYFGSTVALSSDGNTLAVGVAVEDSNATGVNGTQANNSATDSGAVYVFTRSAGAWSQQAYVKASNTDANDEFGRSVALSSDGNTMAVGAVQEGSNATGVGGNQADNSRTWAGAVYVFTRSAGAWSQQAYVKASNTDANDQFGRSVALSSDGNTMAVGAMQEGSNATGVGGNQADNSRTGAGAVYLY